MSIYIGPKPDTDNPSAPRAQARARHATRATRRGGREEEATQEKEGEEGGTLAPAARKAEGTTGQLALKEAGADTSISVEIRIYLLTAVA